MPSLNNGTNWTLKNYSYRIRSAYLPCWRWIHAYSLAAQSYITGLFPCVIIGAAAAAGAFPNHDIGQKALKFIFYFLKHVNGLDKCFKLDTSNSSINRWSEILAFAAANR